MYRLKDGTEDGLSDEDYNASVATLQAISTNIDASCVELRQRKGSPPDHLLTGQYLVRKKLDDADFMEIR